jgi:hypothetical protein
MTQNFIIATALSLVMALGGLVWMDGGRVQASSYEGAAFTAAPVTDAEACSTVGWYNPGYYSAGETIYVSSYAGMPVPYGYPLYGYLGYLPGWNYQTYYPVTTTAITLPPTPYLPNEGQPYIAGNINNYACNAFSNCVPVANGTTSVCPGNPAGITLNSSLTSATCGSATNIDAKVVGPSGLVVADGTPVQVTTSLGMVPGATSTTDGIASVSLVFPPKTTGIATLTVTSGMAKTEAKITVTC